MRETLRLLKVGVCTWTNQEKVGPGTPKAGARGVVVVGKQNACRKSRGRKDESYTAIATVNPTTSGLHLKAHPGWSRT